MSEWDNFWNNVGNAVENAAEAVGNAVQNAAQAVGNAVENAVEAVGNAVENAVENVGNVLENTAEAIGAAAKEVAQDVKEAVDDAVDWTLNVADDVIFDPVDFVTGGAVDFDYENGQFTGELDLGFGSAGISMGQQGFDAHAGFDIGIASGDISFDDDSGFAMSGSAGVDWGPLPYAEGHLNIGEDGTISIGGEVQATLPLPFGAIGGDLSGELHRDADGTYGATTLVDVFADGPGDTGGSFHSDRSFGDAQDTDVLVDGPSDIGASGGGGGDVDTNLVKAVDSYNDIVNEVHDVGRGGGGGGGDASTASSMADSVSALAGSGDLSDALSSGAADVDEVADLLESDAFDDFTTDIVQTEVMESAAEGVWDDVGP